MTLLQRYRKLNLWSKFAFWGSIASIVALLLSLILWTISAVSDDLVIAPNHVTIEAGSPSEIKREVIVTNTGKESVTDVALEVKASPWNGKVAQLHFHPRAFRETKKEGGRTLAPRTDQACHIKGGHFRCLVGVGTVNALETLPYVLNLEFSQNHPDISVEIARVPYSQFTTLMKENVLVIQKAIKQFQNRPQNTDGQESLKE